MSKRCADWVVDNKTFLSFSIFLGFVASLLIDFYILEKHSCVEAQFLACLTAFYRSSRELLNSTLDSQYAFF